MKTIGKMVFIFGTKKSMIVNGKYRFDIGSAGGPERALDVADFLIEKERAAR